MAAAQAAAAEEASSSDGESESSGGQAGATESNAEGLRAAAGLSPDSDSDSDSSEGASDDEDVAEVPAEPAADGGSVSSGSSSSSSGSESEASGSSAFGGRGAGSGARGRGRGRGRGSRAKAKAKAVVKKEPSVKAEATCESSAVVVNQKSKAKKDNKARVKQERDSGDDSDTGDGEAQRQRALRSFFEELDADSSIREAERQEAAQRRRVAAEAAERREAAPAGISAEKAAELKLRRQREQLLGKLAEYYRRKKQDMPLGLPAASLDKLNKHWVQVAGAQRTLVQEAVQGLGAETQESLALEALGVRSVAASHVESSVIDRCTTAEQVQRQRLLLQHTLREERRLGDQCQQLNAKRQQERGQQQGPEDEDLVRAAEALAQCRAARQRVEAELEELEGRVREQRATELATDSVPMSPSRASSALLAAPGGPLKWRRLGSTSAPMVLDEDSDIEASFAPSSSSTAPPPSATPSLSLPTAAASHGGEKRSALRRPSTAPTLPLNEGSPDKKSFLEIVHKKSLEAPKANVGAKEFLARFQKKAAAAVAAAATKQEPLLAEASLTGRADIKNADRGVKPEESAFVKTDTAVKKELKKEPVIAKIEAKLKKERNEVPSVAKTPSGSYKIDVAQLVPKGAVHDISRWAEANPSEYRALVTQGELVPGSKNLMDFKRSVKRKQVPNEDGTSPAPKVRRDDDTNDRTFHRRQQLWEKSMGSGLGLAGALCAKQQVDEDGRPIKGEVKGELGGENRTCAVAAGVGLADDVQVASGLRCPRWLWEALYDYQHTCVRWLWDLQCEKMGGLLADEMGLGKTVQIAAYLGALHHSGILQNMRIQNASLGAASAASSGGVLIVCPATLIAQWRNELNIWYPPLRVCIMHQVGEQERRDCIRVASQEQAVLITSYETLRIAQEELLEMTWVMVILDEGQKIRNPHANVTLAVKQFSTPHRILLSGSPIQNSLQELWSLFDFICPGRLGTLPVFLEEFAEPIEKGNLVGANESKVAAAYECALALRELTQPCILRRTKAECMDVLQLPHKQEQVLFCHLTPEQYQVYIDFLQTEQVRRAKTASEDRKAAGACFFAISILRKLCNHPDLLLRDADPSMQPQDMWNFERSGKMKVLAEIMKSWKAEGHRPLIFVQTVQMLDVIQRWMVQCGYTFLRIDGGTAVKRRLKLIEEYNGNVDIFAMILTTRVGGVGLNIIGADRVVIFDPDWNPMTDVQARERTWRIGQQRDVTIYRLVLTGTVEEKIYQRQVYKHFLSQKILNDPRQRQFFKWNDLADLFDIPPMPPNFSTEDLLALKMKYKDLFSRLKPENHLGDEVETTDLMKSISELPTKTQHKASQQSATEHSAILKTLYDANGIKATFNHDKVEQSLLDSKIVRKGASIVASRAVAAVQRSARECAGHHISEPTWTGQRGRAGVAVHLKHEVKQEVKRERDGSAGSIVCGGGTGPNARSSGSSIRALVARSGASSAHILDGLRQLAAIRATAFDRGASQSDEASRNGVKQLRLGTAQTSSGVKQECGDVPDLTEAELKALAGDCVGLPVELHAGDREIAEFILAVFLDPKVAGYDHSLTTGQVLQLLAPAVAAHHMELFKSLLKLMCELSRPASSGQPGVWTLRRAFWPSTELS